MTTDKLKRPRRTRTKARPTCAECHGEGQVPTAGTTGTFNTWAFCLACCGDGQEPDAA
jgi:DnaJ-class molecular chaperone